MNGLFDFIAVKLFAGGSPERQNVSIASSNIWDIFGGTRSSSGVVVGNDTALGYPAVWRGVNLLATQVAKLPLHVYRRLPEGGKEFDREHPSFRLLRRRPSPEYTAYTFLSTLMGHALLHRGGFAWIRRDTAARPLEMLVLNPLSTWPIREDGRLMYRTLLDGREFRMLTENVFHVKGLGWDGLNGYSVIDKLKEAIGLGIALQKHASVFFANNAAPKVIIEMPTHFKDEEAIETFRRRWSDAHGGLQNAHRPAILEDGAKLHAFAMNHEDVEFLANREFEIRQIANVFGLPSHKLGDTTKTSFASLEQENQSFLDDALDPWLVNIEEEATTKLLTEEEKENDTHLIEFRRQALVRADMTTRYSSYAVGITNRFLLPNEAREFENLNPVPGGDVMLVPLNMGGPAGEEDEPEPEEDDADRDDQAAALRTLLLEALARMTRRVATHATRAARKPKEYHAWLDALNGEHGAVFVESVGPVLRAIRATLGCRREPDAMATAFFASCHARYLEAGDGPPEQFECRVAEVSGELEFTLPATLADSVIRESKTYQIEETNHEHPQPAIASAAGNLPALVGASS